MTDRRKLRRNDHPSTSHQAAVAVDAEGDEAIVLAIHVSFGLDGCITTQLRDEFWKRVGTHKKQHIPRRTRLHDDGLVLRVPEERMGDMGVLQGVYVARSVMSEVGVQWLKDNCGWLNPCLFGPDEKVPLDPNKKFVLGDRVRKRRGSEWHGVIVGEYSTDLTPEGYCVESEREPGSVQIYPASALELYNGERKNG